MNINKILAQPANKGYSIRGADMGRRSQTQGEPEKLHLQKLRMNSGDCYDSGGAYWGCGSAASGVMWCAFSPENTANDIPVRVFVRAVSREHAKQLILEQLESGFAFFR